MLGLRRSASAVLFASAALVVTPAPASDPVGVYALIDRVALQPDATNAKTVQIWGVFALSPGVPGDAYQPPERGYLFYTINPQNERASRAEWADLSSAAGTGQLVGFGRRYGGVGRVRRSSEPAVNPDVYPLGFGLVSVPQRSGHKAMTNPLGSDIEREVRSVPAPVAPADGERVPAGQVRLIARNVSDTSLRYIFEIEGAGSARETSQPLAAGNGQTAWSPRLQVRGGEQYTWRVRVTNGRWNGQPAVSSFRAGP